MNIDPSLWLLLTGILIGWTARLLWTRSCTLNPKTPEAAREPLRIIAASLADGRLTPDETARIAASLLTLVRTALGRDQDP